MRPSSAKAKGRRFQQYICQKVSDLLGIPWGPEDDRLIQSRPMGQTGGDVILRGEALKRFKFSVECKNCEKWNMKAFMDQAKSNQTDGTRWLLALKRNNEDPVVVMDCDDFFNLLDELYSTRIRRRK